MKQEYIDIRFNAATADLISKANVIIETYRGMSITVRQLYYRLVAADVIPNSIRSYKRIVKIITDARMAGLIDWDAIEDRARQFQEKTRWRDGQQIIDAAANGFHRDMWEGQDVRPFVLVEKDALSGVLAPVCYALDVPLLACKGYASATVMREFAVNQVRNAIMDGQTPIILHLGDHDPSGIDMTRDLNERISLFLEIEDANINRLALNMPQIERLKPPPNPAKESDARFKAYRQKHGVKCWELDALPPDELQRIVREAIRRRIDWDLWERRIEEIEATKKRLKRHAKKFK
jgi:hypothetical protein